MRGWRLAGVLGLSAALLILSACEYAGLLRPSVLGQVDPEMATLMNELPNLDEPNEAIIGRIYATGGASRAELGSDGIMRDKIRIPKDEYLWYPAVIIMPRGGPVTYSVNGTQYIAVPTGAGGWIKGFSPELLGHERGSTLFAFSLADAAPAGAQSSAGSPP